MGILTTILVFIVILTALVLIHEFGHFMAARIIGVKVEEFGVGLPPRLFGRMFGGTLYSVNALPIGGFVKLAGEDVEEAEAEKTAARGKHVDTSMYFWARSKGERAVILLAGVTMNFILAVGIMAYILTQGVLEPSRNVTIESVASQSPASVAGITVGTKVASVTYSDGGVAKTVAISDTDTLISIVKSHAGSEVTLHLTKDGAKRDVTLVPRKNPPAGQGALGVGITNMERKFYPWYEIPVRAVTLTFERAWLMLSSLGNLVWRFATGKHVASEEVAGPVGIARVTGQAVKYGFTAVLEFASILSLNLAVINVLPFPALDGGRLLFVILEKFGKKFRPAFERTVHQIGMIILLILIGLITIKDVFDLIRSLQG